jgi:hypothetical protein
MSRSVEITTVITIIIIITSAACTPNSFCTTNLRIYCREYLLVSATMLSLVPDPKIQHFLPRVATPLVDFIISLGLLRAGAALQRCRDTLEQLALLHIWAHHL